MLESGDLFDRISTHIDQGRIAESLDILEGHFRHQQKFAELFEILKTRIRHDLGLPLIYSGIPDDLTPEQQQQLETGLLQACQEVGTALLKTGRIAEGWIYLQPVSDRDEVQTAIEQLVVNDDNVDEVIEIALGQWAAPAFGFRLLLNRRGTCNAITFFDTQGFAQPEPIRQLLADQLVEHVYRELSENVGRCIAENEGATDSLEQARLAGLIRDRGWLFEECGHHLDVTHLAAVLRIARICDQRSTLEQALELAEYGCRLDPQLALPGEPPFAQTFVAHRFFFQALLGIDTRTSVDHFVDQAESAGAEPDAPACRQVLMELLHRTGDSTAAIDQAMQLRDQMNEMEFTSLLMQLAKHDVEFERIIGHFRDRQEPLPFLLASIRKHDQQTKKTRLENQTG